MSTKIQEKAMGWLPDYPDFRDYTVDQKNVPEKFKQMGFKDTIKDMLSKIGVYEMAKLTLASSVDLREWCSAIEDQESLGSCTAQAGVGLLEYYERRAFGRHIDASRLFLYKVTRNLLHSTGDTGAYCRTTMGAMVLFGAPPEEYWPYNIADFDIEPPAFCYAYGQNYQALRYYRLDPLATPKLTLLNRIKANLAGGLPSMFGFSVFSSYAQARKNGKIPYPVNGESRAGGHAVVAVGYDDKLKITNKNASAKPTVGALLIRNSWGTDWGEDGYGWLPYEYVMQGLAVDWWSLIKSEWIDTGQFGLG
ncbi:cysteine protease [candidate division KSB1 bacterium]|nr:cysteine protease [candidate division KSB1 bacterium]